MIAYVVTEGQFDAALLRRLLPDEIASGVQIVPAGGLSAAKSLARSLLALRQRPVAIVMDSDSVVPATIMERRQSAEEAVQGIAGNVPIRVIMAVPELEAVLFRNPAGLERILGAPIPIGIGELAETRPRKALDEWLRLSKATRSKPDFLKDLRPDDLDALRKAPEVNELIDFLKSVRSRSLSAAGSAL